MNLKSRDTVRVSFDASMKDPMNFVEERFKHLNMYGRPVEVIPYPGDNTLKVLTDAFVEFEPPASTTSSIKQNRGCTKEKL